MRARSRTAAVGSECRMYRASGTRDWSRKAQTKARKAEFRPMVVSPLGKFAWRT